MADHDGRRSGDPIGGLWVMSEPKLARIDQFKLRESVYSELCEAFTRGAFAPGETLSLRALAAQLGTSLTPVREAVRRLVAEGALVDTPSRTLQVPRFDAARLLELKSARLALEALLLSRAIDRIQPIAVARLEAMLSEPGRRDGKPDLQLNHRFHFALYKEAGSDIILPIVKALWLQYGAYLGRLVDDAAAADVVEHVFHEQIVDAVRRGDKPAAEHALSLDIDRSFELLLLCEEPGS